MKVFLYSNDNELQSALLDITGFDSIQMIEPEEQSNQIQDPKSVIIVTDEAMTINDLIIFRKAHKETPFIYVLTLQDDLTDAKLNQSICKAHQIKMIYPNLTYKQIAAEVEMNVFQNQRSSSKVVACMSTIARSGLTASTILLGKEITQQTDIKVGILSFNGFNPGTSLLEYKGKYLDEIWGSIESNYMKDKADLLSKMDEIHPNLFYLGGNRDFLKIYKYTPEGISNLIQLAQELFHLVLIDVGNYIDTPLAYQGIKSSDFLFVHTNQEQEAKDNWIRQKEQILERWMGINFENPSNIWLICNRMYSTTDIETDTQLQNEMRLTCMARLPNVNTFYRVMRRKNIMEFSDKHYQEGLDPLVHAVIDYYSFTYKADKTKAKRRNIFSFGGK